MTAAAPSESEHVALAEVIDELCFLRQVKGFLTPPIDHNIVIGEDYEGAVKMATNRFSSGRTRHVDVKRHIVHDVVESHGLVLQFSVAGKNDIQGDLVPVRYDGTSAALST